MAILSILFKMIYHILLPFLFVILYAYLGLDDFEAFENRALVIPSATRVDEAVCSTINILGDDVRESDEVFSIMAATADPNDSIVGLNSFTITIIDNGDGEYTQYYNAQVYLMLPI